MMLAPLLLFINGVMVMPASNVNHFEAGRAAYKAGDYERAMHEMMLVVIQRPKDVRAREYMRLAGERLAEQDIAKVGAERRDLLTAYRQAMDKAKLKADIWNGWVTQSRAAAASKLFARGYDDAQRVLDDNAFHGDALEAQKEAALGIARLISGNATLAEKDGLIYRGIFLIADKKPAEALRAIKSALAVKGEGEIPDERLKLYVDRLTPKPVAVAALPALPVIPPVLKPARTVPVRKPRVVAAPKPGQWAYSQGIAKLEAQEYEEAAELLERAEAEGHELAAEALARARKLLAELRAAGRKEAAQLYSLGLMLYGQGRRAEAVERWRRAVKLDPEHGYAARALSHAEQELREEGR